MMRHTFWHARGKANDLAWMNEAEASVKNNSWTSPMFVDGSYWEDSMRKEAATKLFQALGKNTSVSRVILQNACIDQNVDLVLTKAMKENEHLRSLTLRNLTSSENNRVHQDPTPPVYTVPPEVFERRCLETLNLAKTSLDAQSCLNLSTMIRESTSLQTLVLDSVQTTPRGLLSVLAAVIMSKSLNTLKLQNLDWTKQDVQRLLVALSFNRSITTLHLEGMSLNADDAQALAHFLQRNKTVTTLSLRKNYLDATAARILIVHGMLHNTTVKGLFLSRNPLGDDSADCLVRLLHESCSLQELCLVKTKLTQDGSAAIARALARSQGLSKLSMDGNGLEACGKVLVGSLQSNVSLVHVMDRLCVLLAKNKRHQKASIWGQVDVLLRANQAGRRIVRCHDQSYAAALVPMVMVRATNQPNVLFQLLREGIPHFAFPTAQISDSCSIPKPSLQNAHQPSLQERKQPQGQPSLQRRSCCPPIA